MQQRQLLHTVRSKYDIGLIGLIPFAKVIAVEGGEFAKYNHKLSESNVLGKEAPTTKIKASLDSSI